MFTNPHVGGFLFQVLAVLLGIVAGIKFVFSRQIQAGLVKIRAYFEEHMR